MLGRLSAHICLTALSLLLSACGGSETSSDSGLIVVVSADADLAAELDEVTVRANDRVLSFDREAARAAGTGSPIVVTLLAASATARVDVRVDASLGDGRVLTRRASLPFATDEKRAYYVHLANACVERDAECAQREQTCGNCGQCVPLEVAAADLSNVASEEQALKGIPPLLCEGDTLDGGGLPFDAQIPDAGDTTDGSMDGGEDAATPPDDAGPLTDADAPTDGGSAIAVSVPLSVSITHACAIRGPQRKVYCWGYNNSLQLGSATTPSDFREPVLVGGEAMPLQGAVAVTTGWSFSCAIGSDARAYCWGARDSQQTGTRNQGLAHRPNPVVLESAGSNLTPLENIVQIAAGGYHACALNAAGQMFCWGANNVSQLGSDTSPNDTSFGARPVALPSEHKVKLIAVGSVHSCAVTEGDELYCWGGNEGSQAGLRRDASDAGIGTDVVETPRLIELNSQAKPVVQLSGGQLHSALRAADGSVWTWGSHFLLQLGWTPEDCQPSAPPGSVCGSPTPGAVGPELGTALTVAAGSGSTCAVVRPEREIDCVPSGTVTILSEQDAAPLEPLQGVTQLALGVGAGCAQLANDEIHCWGRFSLPGNTGDLVISPALSAVRWTLPE